jgi:uncharacterized protein (DUF433 family)
MSETKQYRFLEARPGSNYRQLFLKGKRIRAEVLYRETVGLEPRTPEQVAEDYGVPLEAVLEAIDYCQRNPDVLREDWEREEANVQADEAVRPPRIPPASPPES